MSSLITHNSEKNTDYIMIGFNKPLYVVSHQLCINFMYIQLNELTLNNLCIFCSSDILNVLQKTKLASVLADTFDLVTADRIFNKINPA